MPYNMSDVCNATMEAFQKADMIVQSLLFCVGMPAVSLACYAAIRLVRVDHTTPVYVINLLALDILQILIKPLLIICNLERTNNNRISSHFMFLLGQFGSIGFVLCISVERYVAVAHPLWYQGRHTFKCSVQICLAVWILILTITLLKYFLVPQHLYFRAVLSLLLYICVVICYVGTWRTIQSVRSIPDEEKKRIMHLLGMVVGTYGVLLLPQCFLSIYMYIVKHTFCIPKYFADLLVQFNSMVDPFLYIFIRRDVNVREHCCVTLV